jgi:zinc and cadmium transporter
MISTSFSILLATGFVALISLIGIFALSLREETLHSILFFLVAFSAGSILGAALFDLLPEAIELVDETQVFRNITFGFIAFFFLERFIYWYHGHGHLEDIEEAVSDRGSSKGFAILNLLGDGIHNFIDGMIIAASFTAGYQVGVATTIAVIFHELPQEMGDYGILIYAGFDRLQSILLNFFAAFSVVLGGVFAIFFLRTVDVLSGFLVSFSAGAFIYLAASELIPELKEEDDFLKSILQFAFFLFGLALIWSLGLIFPE